MKWVGVVGLVIVVTLVGIAHLRPTAEEELAAFDAAQAVPDTENAAISYDELLQHPSAAVDEILDDAEVEIALERAAVEPWTRETYPEIVAWITAHSDLIAKLIEISRFDRCQFPIRLESFDEDQARREMAMLSWTCLLCCAVNNDIGEGRIDEAITKWRCLIQMENHLRQQPWTNSTGIGRYGVESMVRFIVQGNPSETLLRRIETLPLPIANDWSRHFRDICLIEELRERKKRESLGFWEQIRYWYSTRRSESEFGDLFDDLDPGAEYLGFLAGARAIRILVAAKCYHYKAGHWPDSLNDVKSALPPEALIDPLSGEAFVYRRIGNTFRLYSKGRNKIDENGDWKSRDTDDWPIWPGRGEVSNREQDIENGV